MGVWLVSGAVRAHVICIKLAVFWKKHKLVSRLPGKISITSDMQMTPPLWQKVKTNSKAS